MALSRSSSVRLSFSLILLAALGCGGAQDPTAPGPLKERDKVMNMLPSGVTLESPVKPNKLYGESSKTVEDALAAVQAYVRDGVLYDGIGHEIHFDPEPRPKNQPKAARNKKPSAPKTVITLAK